MNSSARVIDYDRLRHMTQLVNLSNASVDISINGSRQHFNFAHRLHRDSENTESSDAIQTENQPGLSVQCVKESKRWRTPLLLLDVIFGTPDETSLHEVGQPVPRPAPELVQ
jgi:hypothetical protein